MQIFQLPTLFLLLFFLLACESQVADQATSKVNSSPVTTQDTTVSPEGQNLQTSAATTKDSMALEAMESGTAIAPDSQELPAKGKENMRNAESVDPSPQKVVVKKEGKKRKKKRPVISFDHQTHPYGRIRQGETVDHQFYFTNVGNAPLTITNVKVSCGCTHPSYPFVPIAPGEKGYIGVNFDSKGKLGKQRPMITVITNASPSTYKLYLEGFVDTDTTSKMKTGEVESDQPNSKGQ